MPAQTTSLPVIDIGGLFSEDLEDRRTVSRAIRAACIDSGFFYVANHGVEAKSVEQAFSRSREFFAQPLADKMAVAITHSPVSRGYEPIGG